MQRLAERKHEKQLQQQQQQQQQSLARPQFWQQRTAQSQAQHVRNTVGTANDFVEVGNTTTTTTGTDRNHAGRVSCSSMLDKRGRGSAAAAAAGCVADGNLRSRWGWEKAEEEEGGGGGSEASVPSGSGNVSGAARRAERCAGSGEEVVSPPSSERRARTAD